jgi:hypothetical protein
MLAESEVEQADRVINLIIEREAYRTLAQEAIHALHDMTIERDQLRTSQHRLINEVRALRLKTLRQQEAA